MMPEDWTRSPNANELSLLRVEMAGKLDRISDQLREVARMQEDHELRLRSVERWKLSIPISVLLVLATVVGAAIGKGGGF